MKLLKNRMLWVIIGVFILACIIHYSEIIGIPGTVYPSVHLGLTRHTLDRMLFLIPVIHATFLFRKKGAWIVSGAALGAMLPRVILLSPAPVDALVETLGILAIGMIASWGFWTRAEERDNTKMALDKCQSSHEILQHYVQSVRKNEKRQTILNTISSLLGESLELEATLKKAVQMVSELMEVEITMIFSLAEDAPKLMMSAYEGVSDEFARALDGINIGEGVYGEVARTCQPIVVENGYDKDPYLSHPDVKAMKIQVQLIVPMIIKSRIRGVLCVAMRRPRKYTPEDIELLTAVGTQIATAIENARLYEKERQAAQRLTISERNYRQLFEQASDAIWVHNMQGNITEANRAATKLAGYSIEELKQMNVKNFLSPNGSVTIEQLRRRLMGKEPTDQPYEITIKRKDGSEAILKMSTGALLENGRPKGFQNIARDVTIQKRSEEMLTKIIDGSPLPTFAINKDHIVTHWNIAMESLSKIKKNEIIGTDGHWRTFYKEKRPIMSDLIVNGAAADIIKVYYLDKAKKSYLTEGAYEAEDFFPDLGSDGKWLHFTASPIKDDTGEIIGAIETLRDVTESRTMQERLRYYLGQITQVQEEERKRIARDLHDDTSQALYALARQLDSFTRNNPDLQPSNAAFLKELRHQLKNTLEGIRRFTQELRPPMLDDLGLISTLRWEAGEFERHSGTKVELTVSGDERRFSEHAELLTFRIIQEALRNVEKHAQATNVNVKIKFGDGKTFITIVDDGKGFNLNAGLSELPQSGKLGLAGMEERVRLLGGELQITSRKGRGTKITIELPV